MNKRIAVLCALIGAVALIAAPAYAEVQNIKISGDITAMALYRENYDLLDSRMAAIDDQVTVINRYVADDADSEFVSVVRLRVDADLTDNVGATVALANLREWDQDRNMDTNAATGAPFNLGLVAASETNQDDASIVLDLAYITLKEMLYSPLTLVIGRQNLAYGR
ncbi:MAG: hypothetical protein JW869_05500, partial [Candidatus Omnitrophica bacterium]|nr:hypothetical protein [Candidatus Omnitrophota bacterium]